jgi:hypothetical protein
VRGGLHVEPKRRRARRRCRPCADHIEVRILGPLEVVDDGSPLPLGGNLPRALLAALLLRARTLRTADQLIDDLWCDHAPASARASLHNVLSGLRRALAPDVLESTRNGYVLAVDADSVDASRFERLLARALDAGVNEKVHLLDQAIGLWRGSPLVDFRYDEFAQGRSGVSKSSTCVPSRRTPGASSRAAPSSSSGTTFACTRPNSRSPCRDPNRREASMSKNERNTATIWAPLAQVRMSERRWRSINNATVERYRQWLEQGREAPAVRLARQGDLYVVRDGRHRVAAALAAGHTVVKAELRRTLAMARAAVRRRSRTCFRGATQAWG